MNCRSSEVKRGIMGSLKWLCVYVLVFMSVCVNFSECDPPVFTNLPLVNRIPVEENTPTTTTIFTATATDIDMDIPVYSMTSSPSTGTLFFGMDPGSGEVTIIADIDFETIPAQQYTLTVTAIAAGDSVRSDFTVEIIDKSESFAFDQTVYGISAPEGQPANTFLPDAGFSVTDPDIGDSFTCHMACPVASLGDFTMNTTTCQVFFTGIYSLDFGKPDNVECLITGYDTGGNSNTTLLNITITKVNNYTPLFSLPQYTFSMAYYDPVGTTLAPAGTITATDADIGTDGIFALSIDQAGLASNHFQIDPTTGLLTTQEELADICQCPGQTLTIPLHATDQGGNQGTSTILVNVGSLTTTPSTTTTPKNKTFFMEAKNAAWVAVCIMAALMAALVLCFILFKHAATCPCNKVRRPPPRHFFDDEYRPNHKADRIFQTPIESVRKPPPALHEWQRQGQILP